MADNESNRDKQQHVEEMSQCLDSMIEKTEDRIERLHCDLLDAELEKEHSHSTAMMADNESNCDKQQHVEEMLQSRKRASLDAMLEKNADRIKRLRCNLLNAELNKMDCLLRSKASSEENHK
jgi:hypothetical protein